VCGCRLRSNSTAAFVRSRSLWSVTSISLGLRGPFASLPPSVERSVSSPLRAGFRSYRRLPFSPLSFSDLPIFLTGLQISTNSPSSNCTLRLPSSYPLLGKRTSVNRSRTHSRASSAHLCMMSAGSPGTPTCSCGFGFAHRATSICRKASRPYNR
jgi:hypothetical protein